MPGAGKQPPEIQEHIKELLEAGFDPTTIHRRLKVGRSSIYRMKRCLQQHGTAYMPVEMNKKNGRPKVLSGEQELVSRHAHCTCHISRHVHTNVSQEVRDWLRKPENRTRYLDDLVWLIHDRFGIVCSTTTMSKMKRKWLRVIEYEETGQPLDTTTRDSLLETHPNLPILHDERAMPMETHDLPEDFASDLHDDLHLQADSGAAPVAMMQAPEAAMVMQQLHGGHHQIPIEPQIDSQLEQQIQTDIASAEPSHA